jgi:hypothetical protein
MNIRNSRPKRNNSERIKSSLSDHLIAELSAASLPATDAGRFIHSHHLVDPRIADLVAHLAGLGLEETAR